MQINSPESMKLARDTFEMAGFDWSLVRAASTLNDDGVLVIDESRLRELAARSDAEHRAQ
jgi:hypothetical protein